MDLSDIINEDDYHHIMSSPNQSNVMSPKSNDESPIIMPNHHHHQHHQHTCSSPSNRVRQSPASISSRPSVQVMNELNSLPYGQSLRGQIESMTPDELRISLLDKARELRKLRTQIQNIGEENYQLRRQLTTHLNSTRSHSYSHSHSHSRTGTGTVTGRRVRSMRISNSYACSNDLASVSLPAFPGDSLNEFGLNESNSLVTEAGDGNVGGDEDEFLLPEDLKGNQEPSRISVFISQSMTVLAQINNEEMIEKVCAGSQIARKVVVGGVVGYVSSHLLKKFGKFAATSIFGSIILIKMAHHRGYISVDWNRIQKQIESSQLKNGSENGSESSSSPLSSDNEEESRPEDELAWLSQKAHQIRLWSRENTYSVLGFWGGFLAHNLHT